MTHCPICKSRLVRVPQSDSPRTVSCPKTRHSPEEVKEAMSKVCSLA